jgi:hypothetical protein
MHSTFKMTLKYFLLSFILQLSFQMRDKNQTNKEKKLCIGCKISSYLKRSSQKNARVFKIYYEYNGIEH